MALTSYCYNGGVRETIRIRLSGSGVLTEPSAFLAGLCGRPGHTARVRTDGRTSLGTTFVSSSRIWTPPFWLPVYRKLYSVPDLLDLSTFRVPNSDTN